MKQFSAASKQKQVFISFLSIVLHTHAVHRSAALPKLFFHALTSSKPRKALTNDGNDLQILCDLYISLLRCSIDCCTHISSHNMLLMFGRKKKYSEKAPCFSRLRNGYTNKKQRKKLYKIEEKRLLLLNNELK